MAVAGAVAANPVALTLVLATAVGYRRYSSHSYSLLSSSMVIEVAAVTRTGFRSHKQ